MYEKDRESVMLMLAWLLGIVTEVAVVATDGASARVPAGSALLSNIVANVALLLCLCGTLCQSAQGQYEVVSCITQPLSQCLSPPMSVVSCTSEKVPHSLA